MDSSNHDPGPLQRAKPLAGDHLSVGLDCFPCLDGQLLTPAGPLQPCPQEAIFRSVPAVDLPATLMLLPPDRVEESPISDILPADHAPLPPDVPVLPVSPGDSVSSVWPLVPREPVFLAAGVASCGQPLTPESESQISEFTNSNLYIIPNLDNCLQFKNSDIYKNTDQNSPVLVSNEGHCISRNSPCNNASEPPPCSDIRDNELIAFSQPAEKQVSSISSTNKISAVKKNTQQESTIKQLPPFGMESYSQVTSKLLPDQASMGLQPHVEVTKECAVLIERLQNSNLDIYCRAIERQIGPNNIIFLGRAPGDMDKILVFLENHRLAEKLVRVGVNIRGRWLMVSFLSLPATRVVLSDVLPFIEDEVLIRALLPYGTVATPQMRKIRAATKHPSFRNIFSYRREIYIYIRQGLSLPATLDIDFQGETYVVEVSTEGIKCFRCGRFGHSITFCDVPQTSIGDKSANNPLRQPSNTLPSQRINMAKLPVLPKRNDVLASNSERGLTNKKATRVTSNTILDTLCIHEPVSDTQPHISLSTDMGDQKGVMDSNSENNSLMELDSCNISNTYSYLSIPPEDLTWNEVSHRKKRKRKKSTQMMMKSFLIQREEKLSKKA